MLVSHIQIVRCRVAAAVFDEIFSYIAALGRDVELSCAV
jgi:hypothetical protein